MLFRVEVTEHMLVEFEIEADSEDDAVKRVDSDGQERSIYLLDRFVSDVQLVSE